MSDDKDMRSDWKRASEFGVDGVLIETHPDPTEKPRTDITDAVMELARAAIAHQYAMNAWNESFPGVCPGCFRPHARISRVIKKGLCVNCQLKKSRAIKQIQAEAE